jgi:uncharacterized membrane protein
MGRSLLVGSLLWPVVLGAATLDRSSASPTMFSTAIYTVASRICHQRPERSFTLRGVAWPVCGRCLGLYLSAPIGAAIAWSRRRRRARLSPKALLVLASVPTIVTLALEWTQESALSNVIRAASALPLGAAIAAVLVREAAGDETGDQLH